MVNDTAEAIREKPLRFVAAGRTDTGLKRPHNEDTIDLCADVAFFAVADGMGGHAAGEVASRAAMDTLHEFIIQASRNTDQTFPFGMDKNRDRTENIILNGIQLANRKVCQMAAENRDYSGMGTTLALVYAPDGMVRICHVGDSRVYLMRQGRLQLLTMDHSWVNEQLQRNVLTEDEARTHRWRNVITRALGNRMDLEIDMKTIPGLPGDLFLLCSDGLTGMLRDEEIAALLTPGPDDLDAACEALVQAANEAGGLDNISVVLARILE